MDFVAKEIFYLFWFSSMLGTIGGTVTGQANQAVLEGTEATITCTSAEKPGDSIKWSFTAFDKVTEIPIKEANGIIKNTKDYAGHVGDDSKSYTLTINKVSASTAGTYTCDDTKGKYLVLIIVFKQTCDYFPKPTNTHPCDSTVTLSCAVECFAKKANVIPNLTWLDAQQAPVGEATSSSPSTLNVTWTGGQIPIYSCEVAFGVKDLLPAMNQQAPATTHQCKPFESANDAPCGQKEDPGGKGDPNSTDDPEKSGQNNFSVRSAETNNLAIRVLGVAGVLLLAQVL